MGKKKAKDEETVLLALSGMSPAVVTETIWALAHQKEPVIPNRVIVLTTTKGKEKIRELLFSEDEGWERMKDALEAEGIDLKGKLRFGLSQDAVRLFPSVDKMSDLTDIATSEDNSCAADFILSTLRELTENPSIRVLASLAGGRKTMSALMLSCMSLLGRSKDCLLHVLVNSPFDSPLTPPFIFPESEATYTTRAKEEVKGSDARLSLIEVPFVRMRGWYQEKFDEMPPSYQDLVNAVQNNVPEEKPYPKICFDYDTHCIMVNDVEIDLSCVEFATLAILSKLQDPRDVISKWKSDNTQSKFPAFHWTKDLKESSLFSTPDDQKELNKNLSHTLSEIRKKKLNKVKKLFTTKQLEELLPPAKKAFSYPQKKIAFKGEDPFAGIRG